MHRGYTRRKYLDRLAMARETIPGLAVSTDVIVGFPGETDQDFQDTLDVLKEAEFDSAFMFIFSSRPGTRAADMAADFVPDDVIKERFGRLIEVQDRISHRRNREMVGRRVEVLSEGPSKRDLDMATTRTRTGKLVHVAGKHPSGSFFDVDVVASKPHHLLGSPV
jgi:tRNA-2-methylthio-N6-dimethylallyladenosine synthase